MSTSRGGSAKIKAARKQAGPKIDSAVDTLGPGVERAREVVVPALGSARDALGPAWEQARESAAPYVADARKRAEKTLRTEVIPRVNAGLAASEPARAEAARRGVAALSALRGDLDAPKPKRRKLGAVVLVAVVGAAGAAAYKAWKQPHRSDDWIHADTYVGGGVPSTAASTVNTPSGATTAKAADSAG